MVLNQLVSLSTRYYYDVVFIKTTMTGLIKYLDKQFFGLELYNSGSCDLNQCLCLRYSKNRLEVINFKGETL